MDGGRREGGDDEGLQHERIHDQYPADPSGDLSGDLVTPGSSKSSVSSSGRLVCRRPILNPHPHKRLQTAAKSRGGIVSGARRSGGDESALHPGKGSYHKPKCLFTCI